MHMKAYWTAFALVLASLVFEQTIASDFRSGDLIFVSLKCGPTCEAIEKVTQQQFGVSGPSLSHLGLIERTADGQNWVWEAWPGPGVQRISLEEFLSRPHHPSEFRHLSMPPEKRHYLPALFDQLRAWQGHPYNRFFFWDRSSFYCSELIYRAWQAVAPELRLFSEAVRPMEFGTPLSRERLIWKNYFSQSFVAIPIGHPGISPLGLYLSAQKSYLYNPDSRLGVKEP